MGHAAAANIVPGDPHGAMPPVTPEYRAQPASMTPRDFFATAIVVLIASPADTMDERAAVQRDLSRWNVDRGERESAVVIPWLYEQHAVPLLGGAPTVDHQRSGR